MTISKRGLLAIGLCLASCTTAAPPVADTQPDTLSKIDTMIDSGELDMSGWQKNMPDWFASVEPFKVIGEDQGAVYFVGTKGLGMYFIPTKDGHIVIDGGMPGQGRYVADAITKLGYDPQDVKILLNSHAHLDHSGGLAELKTLTGAQLLASEGDRSALEGGFYLGSEKESYLNAPPVKVDAIIADGKTVSLGGVTLTAHITPGHSRGCTSWMMDVKQGSESFKTLFFCSASVAANRLIGPPQYEGIVEDYRKTFAITKDWQPDIFLSNHPEFFGMAGKQEKLDSGDPLAFVDRDGFPVFIAKMKSDFEAALQKQMLKHNAIMN
ncbi:subclass B3 metallo-beta-lactamase [Parasphingorhabdus halotolerans]|uniref:Subclass B3 metallo-beta-lactamase n=1 Tax=Parasphingorhabdus halotolerans TaxID=2725558 RepID=A0A6H2DQE3_9SPHN|nr:subclass B3 metallo-beta-lactamase [Parasphingorhabdus halotolerans]QJB69981.1 subclass B3 metallo-beta-lactamase [Parasphingorhabdus halotolerans]